MSYIAPTNTVTPAEVVASLQLHNIIPDVLSKECTLFIKGQLYVIYNDVHIVTLGTEVARSDTQAVPVVEFAEADPASTYTLIMTDPDLFMNNDHLSGQVRHWLQTGLKFDAKTKRVAGTLAKSVATTYIGPAPGALTGKHRYTFILAREPPGYAATADTAQVPLGDANLKGRMQFSAEKYIVDQGIIAEAVAFMLVGPDAASAIENVKLGAESVAHKVVGE